MLTNKAETKIEFCEVRKNEIKYSLKEDIVKFCDNMLIEFFNKLDHKNFLLGGGPLMTVALIILHH